MDDPHKPRFEIAEAAMLLLAVLVIAGVLLVLAVAARCAFWFVAACDRDWHLREILAELLVVLVALITRPPPPR